MTSPVAGGFKEMVRLKNGNMLRLGRLGSSQHVVPHPWSLINETLLLICHEF